ncbi:MAG TPA: maltotransferase domain-containing protein, partial [Thermomicrobiales bacterium]|nr:maltotransferase domain-containing protein [Thermomicrobiales bacterium]
GGWQEVPMHHVDNDRWAGAFDLTENAMWEYAVLAFPDPYSSWIDEIEKKLAADLDVSSELLEGRLIIEETLARANLPDTRVIQGALDAAESGGQRDAVNQLTAPVVAETILRNRSRLGAARSETLRVSVDRVRARFAAWYSMFPRSAGTVEGQSATFDDVIRQLPRLEGMGFDVLYFTPIHPIATTNRKGRNNSLVAEPGDPGVPYAIGSPDGGHDAIEPSLGTLDDFRRLVAAAADRGMEIALDVALQASPDHPWVAEHPEWFFIRPDGTIKYAENPPKKYQDIYPLNFNNQNWRALWDEILRVILHWVDNGVRTFRVDNPHTKPTAFWEWLIAEVHRDHPDVIFLSEAFTRPKVMKSLAKAGFAQSYTYFTWRNFKQEIVEYGTELTQTEMKEYFRGNFFTNTHDILPYILQEGGRPAFMTRFALAATMSSVYGIYSGFELCEATPVPGKEEYLDSEKYEFKVWDWDRPGNITDFISRVNAIRREHPALQEYENLRFQQADDDNILSYSKSSADGEDTVLVVLNLDPFQAHGTTVSLPDELFASDDNAQIQVHDLLSGEPLLWTGRRQYLHLDPHDNPVMFFGLRPWYHQQYAEISY